MGLMCLIVDDDPNTVQLIEDSVAWEEYGIEQVECAYQGLQALDRVRDCHPDIIISDIEMPQMGGLQLMEALQKLPGEKPEVIFLTCHADFTFAQEAIRYGVSAYLVKPFQLEELSGALTRTVLKCREKQKLLDDQWNTRQNKNNLERDFIRELLAGQIPGGAEAIAAEARSRKLLFHAQGMFRLVYVIVPLEAARRAEMRVSELTFAFRNLAGEVLYGDVSEPKIVENIMQPFALLILPVEKDFCTVEELKQRCRRLIDVTKTYLRFEISCAISLPCRPQEFSQRREDMDEFVRKNRKSGQVLLEEDDRGEEKETESLPLGDLRNCLLERKKAALIGLVGKYLLRLDRDGANNSAHLQAVHHDLMQVFYGYLSENHIQVNQVFQDPVFTQLNESAEYSSKQMLKYTSFFYDKVVELVGNLQKSESLVVQIQDYIETHLAEDISRETIAASVFVAPTYLSKVFRKEVGVSLREYINQRRIEKAKSLMLSTNRSVTEIALEVGFENIPYFFTIFKKFCGVAPAVWRAEAAYKGK